ncbi:MAG: DeoR/GlpR family DNA-binding transcription regulator [Spirochaetaceae bacterium]|jgi:DeoR/GlpR family transcriptional regulator of sugar metabolism|nr:DeoR/GlpR family DNA-binding transcription regulator [Spirochaetaceae bacterium]
MFQEQRREKILALLRENGSCRVQELSALFKVSEPTIRQDLETLEKTHSITRQHGGAFIADFSSFTGKLTLEHTEYMEEKRRIGAKAAEFIKSGDSIILDSGSTLTELAKCIISRKNLNVITSAINITLILGAEPTNHIMLAGGELKVPTLSVTGEKAAAIFKDIYVEKLFLATGGFSLTAGLTYPGISDIPLKQAMINSAKTVFLLADSSKIEKIYFASLNCLNNIHYLITDENIPDDYVKKLKALGITVIV